MSDTPLLSDATDDQIGQEMIRRHRSFTMGVETRDGDIVLWRNGRNADIGWLLRHQEASLLRRCFLGEGYKLGEAEDAAQEGAGDA